ncbi:MAG TPA: tetratricopeptide repeat protein [Terriglobales bacterium]|jgi:predicted Zn-dependent protease|nr:tetratricopeptide repeat protein [Terriglobales bacterium]
MDRVAKLQEILAQNPNDAFARYGLAMEYANQGAADTALNEFARLLQANPDYTAAYHMSAQTLVKAGREAEARKMLQDGIACATRTRNQHALSEMQALLDELR